MGIEQLAVPITVPPKELIGVGPIAEPGQETVSCPPPGLGGNVTKSPVTPEPVGTINVFVCPGSTGNPSLPNGTRGKFPGTKGKGFPAQA